jgi:acyl carrier protein
MRFEDEFDISIGDDEGESCETVRDVLNLLHGKELAKAV